MEITPSLQTYIEAKILKTTKKFLKGVAVDLPILDLEVGRETKHHRKGKIYYAKANLKIGGKFLRAEVADEDIRAAIDLLEEELEIEVKKFKGRSSSLQKRGARIAKKELKLDPSARFYRKGRILNEGD